jgi:biotin transport system substrate-specific component
VSASGYASVGTAPLGVTLGEELLPRPLRLAASAWQRDAVLIVAGTVLLILGSYVQLYFPINPHVPLTLQTFAVLFTGALLGAWRGASSTALYLLIGIVGFPVFAAGDDGVHRSGLGTIIGFGEGGVVLGATGGYLVAFLLASGLVGWLAERGWDRRFVTSIAAMVAGTVLIYAVGVVWLSIAIGVDIPQALEFGLYPFLPGDIVKLLVAAGLLPIGWRLVSRRASERRGGLSSPS